MFKRQTSECACDSCKSMCRNSPCIPNPEGALLLIAAGLKNKLLPTIYIDVETGNPWPVIAPIKTPSGCIFFRNGLCDLHASGLKPIEGKLAIHNEESIKLRRGIAFTWVSHVGLYIMRTFDAPEITKMLKELKIAYSR